jgi:hypothetical protein
MATPVDNWPAYARLVTVASTGHLPQLLHHPQDVPEIDERLLRPGSAQAARAGGMSQPQRAVVRSRSTTAGRSPASLRWSVFPLFVDHHRTLDRSLLWSGLPRARSLSDATYRKGRKKTLEMPALRPSHREPIERHGRSSPPSFTCIAAHLNRKGHILSE